jgi:pyruvate/2-oxoglutarate dehydrogenase complex dihydrolipoamide acyltransferase (E2) component
VGFFKSPFLHVSKYVPGRRSVVSACAVVAVLAGPVGLATANAVNATPAAAAAAPVTASHAESAEGKPKAKPVAAAPKPASPAVKAAAAKAATTKAVTAKAATATKAATLVKAQPATHAPAPAAKPAAPPPPPPPAQPAKPANPYAGVTSAQLEPFGLYGSQEHFSASSDQWQNARTIVQVAQRRGMSPYAAVIAIATALQESTLRNLTTAVDADSLGLFQQRPSMGWGSASQLTDPAYATGAFLSALKQYAPDYGSMPLWQAAQATQRSGYPTAYARWQDQAAGMVRQISSEG